MSQSQYKPVPVDVARQISVQFDKDVVVITSVDRGHDKIHTTTFGCTLADKAAAARLGDTLATAAGCDLTKKEDFEDFRTRTAAQWAQEKDELLAQIRKNAEAEAIVDAINKLRGHEGASVEVLCPNFDCDGDSPAHAVEVTSNWTNWQPERFGGKTLRLALEAAVADMDLRD